MRLLLLPALALTLAGSGAGAPAAEAPHEIVALSGQITQASGTARFVVVYSDAVILSGAINLGNDTAVLDNHEIDGEHTFYQPIPRQEAAALGIAQKGWARTDIRAHFSLTEDPFIPDTKSFFELLGRADDSRFLGQGEERGTPVRRYSARLGIDAFLAVNPPTLEEQNTKAGPPQTVQMRDYFESYFDKGGQALQLAVDSKGRIRRVELALPIEPLTIQLYDYGVSVDVSPPPANQVITSTEYERLKTEYCSNPKRQIQPRKPPCQ